jgi:hypothetical protein
MAVFQPGRREIRTRCLFDNLAAKGRASFRVNLEVVDDEGTLALTAAVEWFVGKREAGESELLR